MSLQTPAGPRFADRVPLAAYAGVYVMITALVAAVAAEVSDPSRLAEPLFHARPQPVSHLRSLLRDGRAFG